MGRGKRKLEPRGLTLPVKLDGDALDRARQRIAHYNDMGGFRLDAGHGLTQNAMKQFANASASNLALVKHYARKGSTDAYAVLKTMAEEELGRDGRCRPQLADFLIDQLNGLVSRQRGPKKATNFLRDCIFVSVIAEIVYWFNLRPTRNRESRSPQKTLGLYDRGRGNPTGASCRCQQGQRSCSGAGLDAGGTLVSRAG